MPADHQPALAIILGLALLAAGLMLGRYALRQRAKFRAEQDREVGTLDGLFAGEYRGEPKIPWGSDDLLRKPNAWLIVLLGALLLLATGLVTIVTAVAQK
ncbi:hypothetical protein [Allorhizocola rhizosphaerae]|uniref:hypothetical protein n=1 Tax=Allorhizocola rhizosphaerae TaxID=1872709 RepID=UPI000E3DBBD4|nr:hypothetical protein [Allorhizocola rhizosphaerae]